MFYNIRSNIMYKCPYSDECSWIGKMDEGHEKVCSHEWSSCKQCNKKVSKSNGIKATHDKYCHVNKCDNCDSAIVGEGH